jgi:hypothetical protein
MGLYRNKPFSSLFSSFATVNAHYSLRHKSQFIRLSHWSQLYVIYKLQFLPLRKHSQVPIPNNNQLTMFREIVIRNKQTHYINTVQKLQDSKHCHWKAYNKYNINSWKLTKTFWPIHGQTKKQTDCFSPAKNKTNKIRNGYHTKWNQYLPWPSYRQQLQTSDASYKHKSIYVSAKRARRIKNRKRVSVYDAFPLSISFKQGFSASLRSHT